MGAPTACAGTDERARQQQSPPAEPSPSAAQQSPTPAEAVDCSARDLPPEPDAQPELPEPVQETRREIYRAAVRCDDERLEQQALVPLHDEEDFAGFDEFGAYIGYRVLITQDGTWAAFVAGD